METRRAVVAIGGNSLITDPEHQSGVAFDTALEARAGGVRRSCASGHRASGIWRPGSGVLDLACRNGAAPVADVGRLRTLVEDQRGLLPKAFVEGAPAIPGSAPPRDSGKP